MKMTAIFDREIKGRTIDLGCGDGGNVIRADVGIDINEKKIRKAKTRIKEVIKSNLTKPLPFPDESFDTITMNQVLEHMRDTKAFLKECYRILRPNGKILIATPNLGFIRNRITMILFGRFHRAVNFGAYDHVRFFTPKDLKFVLKETGLKDVKIYSASTHFLPLSISKGIIAIGVKK